MIEHSNGNRQKNGKAILAVEERVARMMLSIDGSDNILQLLLVVFLAGDAQHFARFVNMAFFRQPARAARNAEQHYQEKSRGKCGNAKLPTPFRSAEIQSADHVVGKICKQNSEDHVELKQPDQSAAILCRRDLCDVHRTKN